MKTRINSLKFNIKRRKIIEKNSSKFFGKDIPITDYFNGFELSGSTYSGGPTVVADNTGALVTSPAGVLPIEGMRLATTVATGAVLGSSTAVVLAEGVSGGTLTVNGDGSYTVTSSTVSAANGARSAGIAVTVGSRYLFSVDHISGLQPKVSIYDSGFNLVGTGTGSYEFTATNGTARVYISTGTAGGTTTINNLRFRVVIPTWLPTTSLGAPIHPSTPLRTRKGTVSVYGEDFRGPLVEPARTNKCFCRKANPVDTTNVTKSGHEASVLSVVDDVAALAAAGLDKICTSGKVYKLDNSAGTTNAFATCFGSCGNTSVHSFRAYCRVSVGSGLLYLSSTVASHTALSSSTYVRAGKDGITPATVGEALVVRADVGAIVYFILPQLEEGAFSTSPIALDSTGADPLTALTRPAANLTRPTAGTALQNGNNFAIYGRVVPKAAGQTAVYLFGTFVGTDDYLNVVIISGTLYFSKKTTAGGYKEATRSYVYATNTPFEYLAYQHSVHGMGIAVRSWNGSAWSAWSDWGANTDIANITITTTYQIGARQNAGHFAANYPFTKIIALNPALNPQSQLVNWLAKKRI